MCYNNNYYYYYNHNVFRAAAVVVADRVDQAPLATAWAAARACRTSCRRRPDWSMRLMAAVVDAAMLVARWACRDCSGSVASQSLCRRVAFVCV
jgi:hypothetical protein